MSLEALREVQRVRFADADADDGTEHALPVRIRGGSRGGQYTSSLDVTWVRSSPLPTRWAADTPGVEVVSCA